MSYDKSFFENMKGKKIVFKEVSSFPDLKLQFVDSFGDFKVRLADDKNFAAGDAIKVQFVTSFPDVKLQKVTAFPDFEVFIDK